VARGDPGYGIRSWSRSQGLFAGLALKEATLREDLDDNAELYGKKLVVRLGGTQLAVEAERPVAG